MTLWSGFWLTCAADTHLGGWRGGSRQDTRNTQSAGTSDRCCDHRHSVRTPNNQNHTVLNYYSTAHRRSPAYYTVRKVHLRLEMIPPGFFGWKILSAGNTGKKLWWTSFKSDGGVAGGVIKPAYKSFHSVRCIKTSICPQEKSQDMDGVLLPFQVPIKKGSIIINSTTVNHWTSMCSWGTSVERYSVSSSRTSTDHSRLKT